MSSEDIEKGARWFEQIEQALHASDGQGIFFVTPENVGSAWLNFEAGFVASRGGKARISTVAVGMEVSDVPSPLNLFQLTSATKDDLHQLVRSLNAHIERPLTDALLNRAFANSWPELEASLQQALQLQATVPSTPNRSVPDRLSDLVTTTRRLEQALADQSSLLRSIARHTKMNARSVLARSVAAFNSPVEEQRDRLLEQLAIYEQEVAESARQIENLETVLGASQNPSPKDLERLQSLKNRYDEAVNSIQYIKGRMAFSKAEAR